MINEINSNKHLNELKDRSDELTLIDLGAVSGGGQYDEEIAMISDLIRELGQDNYRDYCETVDSMRLNNADDEAIYQFSLSFYDARTSPR